MQWLKELRKMIMSSRLKRQYVETRVAYHFGRDSKPFRRIMRAVDDARDMHRGKKRKNGEPVIVHERAMLIIALDYCDERDVDVLVAIMLHDLYEDYPSDWPLSRVEREYGRRVRELVDAVTKPPKGSWVTEADHDEATFEKIDRAGEQAWRIKFYDRLHNNLTAWGRREARVKKLLQTIVYVLPRAAQYNFLLHELVTTTHLEMKRLKLDHRVMQEL